MGARWRAALVGLALVYITVSNQSYPTACPIPSPTLAKNADGTYSWSGMGLHAINLVVCYSKEPSRVEEWTDLPENGGQFIRALPNDER